MIDWNAEVAGFGTLGGATALIDQGRITASGGTLLCITPITGTGSLVVGNHAILSIGATEAAGVGLAFESGGGTIAAASAEAVAGTITGWSTGDFIDLPETKAASETLQNGTLQLFDSSHDLVGTLLVAGSLATQNFSIALDGNGALISYHG